jgi:hypothetical protein
MENPNEPSRIIQPTDLPLHEYPQSAENCENIEQNLIKTEFHEKNEIINLENESLLKKKRECGEEAIRLQTNDLLEIGASLKGNYSKNSNFLIHYN